MKFKILPFILLVTSTISAQMNLINIEPETFVENKITLSDIADDIRYVPLDNTYPIGSVLSYKILNNAIYICSKNTGLISFDRNGKNPLEIGNYGNGPGEYSTVWSFAIDEKSGTIYILDWRKIEVFSEKGNYIKSIPLPECDDGNCFTRIEYFNNCLFLAEFITNGRAKYDWIIKDMSGKIIKEKKNSIPPFQSRVGASGGLYLHRNNISYWNYYNDTVFSILPDHSFKAAFIISPGKYRLPRQDISASSSNQYFSKLNSYFTPQYVFETSWYIWLAYRFDQKRALTLINKSSQKSFVNYLSADGQGGIMNDIDGGLPFQTVSSLEENGNEYVIALFDAFKLKAYVGNNDFKNLKPNYPEKKLNLESFANNIKETDNPIFCLARLKK